MENKPQRFTPCFRGLGTKISTSKAANMCLFALLASLVNLVDTEWFGRSEVFNTETNEGWITKEIPIDFSDTGKDWKQ